MSTIKALPQPQTDLDFPLMKALQLRRTKRKWKDADISDQHISNILWAACGITHNETKRSKSRRTAPSACNSQAIKVYIALHNGLFRYNEKHHQLLEIIPNDIRENIGTQKMMRSAPAGLIYVSDFTKYKSFFFKNNTSKWYTSTADTGFISQNVYLYCTAVGLNTAVLSLVNREKLEKIIGLGENEKVVYTQAIGMSPDY